MRALTHLALALALAFALPACIPAGGGGGGDDEEPIDLDDSDDDGPLDGEDRDPELDPEDPELDPDPPIDDPPAVAGPAACIDADAAWPDEWRAYEDEVIELVNARRAEGADCRTEGRFGPAAPLTGDEQLRCAARLHSRDMGERGYFDHLDPEGVDPFVRMQVAEYSGFPGGENIAAGSPTPASVVEGWMNSDGHCANIMRAGFSEIGVGYAAVPGSDWRVYWTQVFGRR